MTDSQNNATQQNATPLSQAKLQTGKKQTYISRGNSLESEPAPHHQPQESPTREESVFSEKQDSDEIQEQELFLQKTQNSIKLDPELKKIGLQEVDTVSLDPKQRVHLPISDDKVLAGLNQPVSSSFRWLAEFAFFLLKRAHLSLKTYHGKVVRVIKR